MECNTSELCRHYADIIDVVEPIFSNYGGRSSFSGKAVTIKCFESNGLIMQLASTNGTGKVLVIDGGGSTRRALLNNILIETATSNGWEGILCNGSVCDVDIIEEFDIGIQALVAIPVGSNDNENGESDLAINFGGVTFLPDDYVYADNTGIILSPDPLEIE